MNIKDKLLKLMETSLPKEIEIKGVKYQIIFKPEEEIRDHIINSMIILPPWAMLIVLAHFKGLCAPRENLIWINKDMSYTEKLETLIHEVCHAIIYEINETKNRNATSTY